MTRPILQDWQDVKANTLKTFDIAIKTCNNKNMKITTEICKNAIVEWCLKNPHKVDRELNQMLSTAPKDEFLKIKNWKRSYKQFNGVHTERLFVGTHYDRTNGVSQLMAYVYTDRDDQEIVKLEITSSESISNQIQTGLLY